MSTSARATTRARCKVRPGEPCDIPQVAAIQAASPEAACWAPDEYLPHCFSVAAAGDRVHGFLVARAVGAGEWEILNIAVAPEFRRFGVATALLKSFLEGLSGAVFLEVRQSNRVARKLYKSLGFQELTLRKDYYLSPAESAVVMKYHS